MENFQIQTKIGEGAFASVYKVIRKEDSKTYALKRIKMSNLEPRQVTNCLNQVRILASIRNPYVIGYKQAFYDQKSKSFCLITQFADGGDLSCLVNQKKKKNQLFKEEEIWRLAFQILRGLKCLHSLNIFHRDIKSANILYNKNQQCFKLADMNVSVIAKNGLASTQAGTPYYTSPQIWSGKTYNNKSDVWSLGCVLYQMATQKLPFTGADIDSLKKRVLSGIYDRIPKVYSLQLQKFIQLCLKLNVKERFSVQQLLNSTLMKQNVDEDDENRKQNYSQGHNLKLLATILPPLDKKFKKFKDRLPKSKYHEENLTNNASEVFNNLPKIQRPLSLQRVTNKSLKNIR